MRSSGCSSRRSCARVFRMELVRRSPSWERITSTDASSSCCKRQARGDEPRGGRAAPADPDGRSSAIQPAASGVACPEVRCARARARRPCRRVADPQSSASDDRFRLLQPSRVGKLDGVLFSLRLPLHVRRQIVDFRPEAIIAESPFTAAPALVGRALARGRRPQVVIEVHGDWRTATRLYGSPSRRFLSPLADAVGSAALRRADAVRALSGYTEGLVEEVRGSPPTASFEAYMDLSTFAATPPEPLPDRPTVLFVGMLEAYKNIDGLTAAWRQVVRELPKALLVILGEGSRRDVVDELVAELPEQVEHIEQLLPEGVAAQMDRATVLVLPSRSEGLGRVLVESMARGRGIVAESRRRDPGRGSGRPRSAPRRARRRRRACRCAGAGARRSSARRAARNAAFERYQEWHTTPAEYAARVRSLVEVAARGRNKKAGR